MGISQIPSQNFNPLPFHLLYFNKKGTPYNTLGSFGKAAINLSASFLASLCMLSLLYIADLQPKTSSSSGTKDKASV